VVAVFDLVRNDRLIALMIDRIPYDTNSFVDFSFCDSIIIFYFVRLTIYCWPTPYIDSMTNGPFFTPWALIKLRVHMPLNDVAIIG